MVSSSPVVMLVNPPLIAAPFSSTEGSNLAPSTISQEGDFTTQAPLQIPRTLQSTDLVNSLAFYEVTFITSTTGAIDKIRMDFPAGTGIGAAGLIERVGIGGGTLLKSGSSITYDVTTPVSISAGTFIRLEMFGIKNPTNPGTTFTADITTRDSAGNLIDGPSQTNVYTIKKIVSSDLADGSVTSTKPAESFMKRVTLIDDPGGHAVGWDPDGAITIFSISEPAISSDLDNSFFTAHVHFSNPGIGALCGIVDYDNVAKEFKVRCTSAPADGDELHYVVGNLPEHVICGPQPAICRP
jgi:hypothetical protein